MDQPSPSSREPKGARDLDRLRWIGIVLPVVFVWAFEILRFLILDEAYSGDTAHLVAATLMAGAVLLFAIAMAYFLDRAQRQLVSQNTDLVATHAVTTAVTGALSLPELIDQALERMTEQTGALAGAIRVEGSDGPIIRHEPPALPDGLAWLRPVLDEVAGQGPTEVSWTTRAAIDTGFLDLPLVRGGEAVGRLRLAFHPPVRPAISHAALDDIAGEIATAIQLARNVADIRRRERERAALYQVALQLTGGGDLHATLDTISHHARELLGADRAVVCMADERAILRAEGRAASERIALADDGSLCLLAHPDGTPQHEQTPGCPIQPHVPGVRWMARPMRGPDGLLGELCVVRQDGESFTASDRDLLGALADMAAIAVRTARLHDAEQQYTILSERDRIARELHDSLAQVLGVIHLRLRALEGVAAANGGRALVPEIADIAETADEAYRDVREAILGLRETIGSDTGFEGSLREYLVKYGRQTGIAAQLVCDGRTRGALTPRAEVQLLRVVQEALTNVRKHADARHVVVRLDCTGPAPILEVEDDGVGFHAGEVAASLEGGFGMASMRERVEHIGGTMEVHSEPGQGTRIVVRLATEEGRVEPAAGSGRAPGVDAPAAAPARPAGR